MKFIKTVALGLSVLAGGIGGHFGGIWGVVAVIIGELAVMLLAEAHYQEKIYRN